MQQREINQYALNHVKRKYTKQTKNSSAVRKPESKNMNNQTSQKNLKTATQNYKGTPALERIQASLESLQVGQARLEEVLTTRNMRQLERTAKRGGGGGLEGAEAGTDTSAEAVEITENDPTLAVLIQANPTIDKITVGMGTKRKQGKNLGVEVVISKSKSKRLRQLRAGLNARKMVCDCCPGNNGCTLEGLTYNTEADTWGSNDSKAKPKPMTPLRAWVHARKLSNRMKSQIAPETVWHKCIICDDKTSSLVDIQFGRHQRNIHIKRYHRMTVKIYDEICGTRTLWCEQQVVQRFKQILMNVHKDDYEDRLTEIRRKSLLERKARTPTTRRTL
jgi:hypothetical protein